MIKVTENNSHSSLQQFPSGWRETTLGKIGEYINGRGFKKSEWSDKGLPIIRIQDLTGTGKEQNFFDGELDPRHLVKPGDLLISWSATLGAFLWNGPNAALNQHIFKVRSFVDKKFHYYLIQHIIEDLYRQTHGSGMVHITKTKFEAVPIGIPESEDDQKRIVAEIEKQFSRLDEAVANLKRVKANLKRYKAAVLKAAVEGKLTEEWRKQHPDIEPASKLLERILTERRQKWEEAELAKMKAKGKAPEDDKWKKKYKELVPINSTKLPSLSENWLWTGIETIGFVQLGRQRSPKYHSGPNMKPYLRVQNVFEDRIDLDDVMEMDFPPEDYRKYKLELGDILLNEGQSPEFLGRPAIFHGEHPDVCFTNTLIRVRVYQPILPEYPLLVFRAYMRSGRFTKEGTITTNIAHLSAGRFAQIEYPLPPLEEQTEIVKEAERRLSIINMLDMELDKGMRRAERLRQSILQKAFSGTLIIESHGNTYEKECADGV